MIGNECTDFQMILLSLRLRKIITGSTVHSFTDHASSLVDYFYTPLYKTGSLCCHLYQPKVRASLVELHVLLFCWPNDINGRICKVAYLGVRPGLSLFLLMLGPITKDLWALETRIILFLLHDGLILLYFYSLMQSLWDV